MPDDRIERLLWLFSDHLSGINIGQLILLLLLNALMYLILLVTGLYEIGSILTLILAAKECQVLLTSV